MRIVELRSPAQDGLFFPNPHNLFPILPGQLQHPELCPLPHPGALGAEPLATTHSGGSFIFALNCPQLVVPAGRDVRVQINQLSVSNSLTKTRKINEYRIYSEIN